MTRILSSVVLVLVACPWIPKPVFASEPALARATELYLAAAYDDALGVISQVGDAAASTDGERLSEVKMLCLLALNRRGEARVTIERILAANPDYRPDTDTISPRVHAEFVEARRAVMPGVVQRFYDAAKAAFERKDPQSPALFSRVLQLLEDADLAEYGSTADLRVVAQGFRDLSVARAAPMPEPAPVVDIAPAPAPPEPAPVPTSPVVAVAELATPADTSVDIEASPAAARDWSIDPPVALVQTLPPFTVPKGTVRPPAGYEGLITLIVDEQGNVVSVSLKESVHPRYDPMLLRAALTWKFRPAMQGGRPMRYTKAVTIRAQGLSVVPQ